MNTQTLYSVQLFENPEARPDMTASRGVTAVARMADKGVLDQFIDQEEALP